MSTDQYFRISRMLGYGFKQESTQLGLYIAAVLFEGVGIGMLLPIIQLIQHDNTTTELAANSKLWGYLITFFSYFGVQASLASLFALSFLCIVMRQFFLYWKQRYFALVQEQLAHNVRLLAFSRYLEARADYHDQEQSGGLVNSLSTELGLAIYAILAPVQLVSYGFMAVFYVTLLVLVSGPITVMALVIIGLAGLAIKSLLNKARTSGIGVQKANEQMSVFLVERLGAIRLIRLSGAETAEYREMDRLTKQQRDSLVRMWMFFAQLNAIIEPLVVGIAFAALYMSIVFLGLKLEEIAVFGLIALMRLLPVFKELMATGQAALNNRASLYRLVERLDDLEKAVEEDFGTKDFQTLTNGIIFENVSLKYATGSAAPALEDVKLVIPANKMTAIVGPSGAGKSTLVDLIPRWREPTKGKVLFNDTDISSFSLESLRKSVAFVSQAPLIFNMTIGEQIAYGVEDVSLDEIQDAAKLANAHEFITSFEQGYDTMLGERGAKVSGGQRQRLELARALLQKSPILILDEPTSNLDAASESLFRDSLTKIRQQQSTTIIVVAHRLSTVLDADQIVVLTQGRVDSNGTHSEILDKNEWYRDACERQMLRDPNAQILIADSAI